MSRPADIAAPEARAAVRALLRQIRILELTARKNVAGPLIGEYQTTVRGRGMLYEETRKYVPGEPIRHIEWNITARLGEPYVKVYEEERRREVFLALDVSPSMHVGFRGKTKLEVAVELAATLAVSAVEAGDRVGYVIFADRVLAEARPESGRRQLFRVLRAFLEHTGPWTRGVEVSDPRTAVHAVQRHRRGRSVVFLISDFIDRDIPEDLKYIQIRDDVSLLHVYDPLEFQSGPIVFQGYSPEGSPARIRLRPGETGTLEAMQQFLRDQCGEHRIAFESFSTARPVGPALDAFLHAKRRKS